MDVLGIDIGGVIIQRIDPDADTSFQNDFVKTPPVEGAIETIAEIVDLRFAEHVFLISKCGPEVEALTVQWLEAHSFFQNSKIPVGNIRFCRERAEKALICEALGITHFIDDRLEVLSHLKTVPNLYLFQPRPEEVANFTQHRDTVRVAQSWQRILEMLLADRTSQ